MKSNYKMLGEYIRQVDVRNTEGKEDNLLGVSVQKQFIPSIANTVGTDFKKYKVVKKGQFTYIPDTSRRGDKIAIALLQDYDEGLVSNVYTVFEVIDTEKLLPEYLMLWFSRPEFDRYARFKSHGSVREVMDWDEMCKVELPVPSIEEQRRIVKAYKTITDRIALKKQINDNLEAQGASLFHLLFDDQTVLSQGTISCFGEVIGGATPSKDMAEYFCSDGIVWLTPKDLTATGNKFIYKGEMDITETAYRSCSTKLMPKGSVLLTSRAPVGTVAIAMTELCTNQGFKSIVPNDDFGTEFVYYFLKENKQLLESHSSGTTFMEISGNVLKEIPVVYPAKNKVKKFNVLCKPIFSYQESIQKEIRRLQDLQQTIISKLSSR
ncbi:MAG: restriction endonuclease subunit S [Acutalibacteraceae bacterium]